MNLKTYISLTYIFVSLCLLACNSAQSNSAIAEKSKSGSKDYNFSNITDIALGDFSACVTIDGHLQCWGDANAGEFNVPTDLGPPEKIIGSFKRFCAITKQGLRCWGKTCNGWGDDCQGEIFVPKLVNPRDVASIDLHNYCAADDTGVVCWKNETVFRTDIKNAKQVVLTFPPLGGDGTQIDGCAITDDSSLACWQFDWNGITQPEVKTIPLVHPQEIAISYREEPEACVVDGNALKCWDMAWGAEVSQTYSNLKNPRNVAMSKFGTCVLTDEGTRCWLSPFWAANNKVNPKQFPNLFQDLSLFKTARRLTANDSHICALTDDGVVCIGDPNWPSAILKDLPENLHRHVDPIAGYPSAARKTHYCASSTTPASCYEFSGTWINEMSGTFAAQLQQDHCSTLASIRIKKDIDLNVAVPLNSTPVSVGAISVAACFAGSDLFIEKMSDDGSSLLYQFTGDKVCTRMFDQNGDHFIGCDFVKR